MANTRQSESSHFPVLFGRCGDVDVVVRPDGIVAAVVSPGDSVDLGTLTGSAR